MTEYAHNHPPRCCCIPDDMQRGIIPCPLCPEHGELAQLGNDISPRTIQAHTGERIYACCNQLVGRPHTDYCPTGRGQYPDTTQAPAHISQPPTQTRDYPVGTGLAPVGRRSQPGRHHSDDCPRPGGLDCICGREGEREPTPIATPTHGRCPECGHDLSATFDLCPNPDHRT